MLSVRMAPSNEAARPLDKFRSRAVLLLSIRSQRSWLHRGNSWMVRCGLQGRRPTFCYAPAHSTVVLKVAVRNGRLLRHEAVSHLFICCRASFVPGRHDTSRRWPTDHGAGLFRRQAGQTMTIELQSTRNAGGIPLPNNLSLRRLADRRDQNGLTAERRVDLKRSVGTGRLL